MAKGLYANINARKKAGTSRTKKKSTISKKAYSNMKKGFPKKKRWLMEENINRMQLQLDKHSGQIAKLFSKIDDTNLCIQKIKTSLLQIKWGI